MTTGAGDDAPGHLPESQLARDEVADGGANNSRTIG
jgi:hypothetical protein